MSAPILTHAATTLGLNFQYPLQSTQDSEPTVEIVPGASGQVLTSNPAAPGGVDWETPSPGFTNPMTTKGDVIAGGVAGEPAADPAGGSGDDDGLSCKIIRRLRHDRHCPAV